MKKTILILAMSMVLVSGCSKKTEEMASEASTSAQDSVTAQTESVANSPAENADVNAPSTTPVTEQKPESILRTLLKPHAEWCVKPMCISSPKMS